MIEEVQGRLSDPIDDKPFQKYIHVSKYSRFIEDEKRRETWGETVSRYMDHIVWHLKENVGYELPEGIREDIFQYIYNQDIMPSMRAMMTAGPALKRSGIAAYNCSYTPIDDPRAFDEILYILSHGSGVGFSVESKYTNKLPVVPKNLRDIKYTIVVEDSKEGWAKSFRKLLDLLWTGCIPKWDVSLVRPEGAPLKTFGGYASGPGPLVELFEFTVNIFKQAQGKKLRPIQVFDIVCMVGNSIVSGGVRRSALICLTDILDQEMAEAKSGMWYLEENTPWRRMANISAAYEKKPSMETFVKEWTTLFNNKSGERGIFNRVAAQQQSAKSGRRDSNQDFGTNPCGEIFLRPQGFCNLSEIVVREDDTLEDLIWKTRLATILGTIQSTITNFPYLRDVWKKNAEEERLLGVSLTGIFSNQLFTSTDNNDPRYNAVVLKQASIKENEKWAKEFGINTSAAITCIKPSGTVSLLNGTSAGLHPWYDEYYIRSVRGNNVEPMTQFMKDAGIPNEPDLQHKNTQTVFYFPAKAPEGAITRRDLNALEHLEYWRVFRENWCEHNPSITIQIKDHEWLEVADWVYKHFDDIGGISFLPYDSGSYKQAPFQVCDKETYERLTEQLPEMDWNQLKYYERYDSMDSSRELACSGDSCDIFDISKG